MKSVFKNLQQGLIVGLGIVLVLGISGITYSALSSLTATTSETLTATKWNNLVNHAVPSGAVMAFNLASCPTDWTVADGVGGTPDMRGAFVRGMNGDANSRDVVRTLGDYQADDYKSHAHDLSYYDHGSGSGNGNNNWASGMESTRSGEQTRSTASDGGSETRSKNVALLYCVKD